MEPNEVFYIELEAPSAYMAMYKADKLWKLGQIKAPKTGYHAGDVSTL